MSLPLWNRLSIRIVLFVVVVFSSAILIYFLIFIKTQIDRERNQLIQNGIVFAELSTPLFYQDYLTSSARGFPTFEDLAQEKLQKNPNIVHVAMIALNGKIIFDSADFGSGQEIGRSGSGNDRFIDDPQLQARLSSSTTQTNVIQGENEKLLEIIIPVTETGGDHLFSMKYALSFRSLRTITTTIYTQAILVFLPFIIFTAAAAVYLAMYITRPIIRLIQATEQLKARNFKVRVPTTSTDEIGVLAQAFNQAAANIQDAEQKIEQYNQQLKGQVTDRTKELEVKVLELEEMNKLMVGRELKMAQLKEEIQQIKNQQ